MAKILVVDDQKNMRTTLNLILKQRGHDVVEAASGGDAIGMLDRDMFDVILTDLKMEPLDGLAVLKKAKEVAPQTEVIIMTAFGRIETAIEAMRLGAFNYILKPFNQDEILLHIDKVLEMRGLRVEISLLLSEFKDRYGLQNIIGRSTPLLNILGMITIVAPTDTTVLITGESGTGKELIAKAIYANSRRANKPFVPVNCAALTEPLTESELFGHVKGAFTGAVAARRGLFEEADGGTFFFDEVTELSNSMQAKLLRALQEQEIRRIGDNKSIKVNVRIIAATNQDIEQRVKDGRFRDDLFYRLNVVRIHVPPLRERKKDIPLLARYFLKKYNSKMSRQMEIDDEVMEMLQEANYPGNVRELENVIEKIVSLSDSGVVKKQTLDFQLAGSQVTGKRNTLREAVEETEKAKIAQILEEYPGDIQSIAHELGVSQTTLWRKMKQYGFKIR